MKKRHQVPIVVLGSKGFIGNATYKRLRKRYGRDVFGLSSQDLDLALEGSVPILCQHLFHKPILVVVSGIRAERDDSLEAFKQNIAMIIHIAKAIQRKPLRHCIYISTVSVYGRGPKKGKIKESSPIVLDSLYALSKYAGEKILENSCKENNTPLLILRLPRVYGHGDAYAKYGPSAFVQGILQRGEVTLYGDGKELREFLYVEDVGKIVDVSIAQTVKGLVNVASGISYSFFEAIKVLQRATKKSFKVRLLPPTGQSHDEHYDNARFLSLFPDYSFTSLEKGLLSTLNQSQNNFSARLQG